MKHKLFRLYIALILVLGSTVIPQLQSARAAGPWYVATIGDDNNDCLSPSTPCATIQGAIGKVSAGDTINVAVGMYTGTGTEVVLIDKDIFLFGGWDASFSTQSGMSTIDGQGARTGMAVNSGVTANVEYFVIQNGLGTWSGGIYNNGGALTLNTVILSGSTTVNNSGSGGFYNNNGTLIMNDSIITDNISNYGGGLFTSGGTVILNNSTVSSNISPNNNGGGIEGWNNANLTLNNSTVSNNSGGGILILNGGSLTLNNSTVSGNTIQGFGSAGIWIWLGTSNVNLNNSTISSNNASDGYDGMGNYTTSSGGGIYFGSGGALTLRNTLLSGNVASSSPDCYGAISSSGYNLIGNTSGCTFAASMGDLLNVDPNIGPLQDNSGPTFTHALLHQSPAIDAGSPSGCTDQNGNLFTTDQRGVTRPQGLSCDIGAFEFEAFTINSNSDAVDINPGDGVCDIGSGNCTLRAAIQEANALPGDDIITLPAGTYTLTIPGANEDVAATGDLDITDNLTMIGAGNAIIDGNSSIVEDRVLHITGASNVNILNLTIRGGNPGFDEGGGIFVAGGATLNLSNSTVSGNATSANGGGIRTDSGANLTLNNSTVSNNSASSGSGGGIFSAGVLNLNNSTINGNTALFGGGIYNFPSFTATLYNTIVANSLSGGNCDGIITDGGGNLSWPDATCPGINADPILGSLTNNGGPTETHALLIGSAAIDTAVDANCLATDQRGISRPQGLHCDIGAFEFEQTAFPPPANDNFANAEPIPPLPFNTVADTTNASNEPNEPQNCYSMPNTVWYSFTPTVNTLVRANTQGSTINSNLNIYHDTGSGISGLNFLPSGCTIYYGPITFLAEAGQTYYLQAGGIYGEVGTIQINLEQLPLPTNDNFAAATPVSSLGSTIDFDNTWATFQSGEPNPSCAYPAPPYKTLWFSYTATQTESISASVPGYSFSPFLAVYSGSGFNNLAQLGCNQYSNKVTFPVVSGQTYYFQVGGLYGGGGSGQFLLETTPPPQAGFYYYPGDPSKFDTIQFYDGSYDPGQIGFQTYTWNFGDGTVASGYSAAHKYSADGNYQVTHTVTTTDGRTGSVTQTVQVRTHDVAITKITTPASANVGQTKTITVTMRNIAYPETVQIDLYKSTPIGFAWVATITKAVPALSGNRTTAVDFSYKFTSDDAKLGKVTFKAVASIIGARDAYPADNEAISSITKVVK